jgi:hypothetical protein
MAVERLKHLALCWHSLVYTTSRIFTSVPLSSMLEKATQVKKQKQPLCRISDTSKERVDEDV